MAKTIEIPWVWDRHSHVSLYGALSGCPDLSRSTPRGALGLLKELPRDRISTVVGWHSSRLKFAPEDLDRLPPAILVNWSLHGFALTGEARRMLAADRPDLVAHCGDAEWCERNMERVLAFFGHTAGLTPAKLDAFMTGLRQVGVGAVEDMLLTGAEALRVIQASPWADRIRFWASPEIHRSLDDAARRAVAGLKVFADGALGARTAAMDEPFLGGGDGFLLYSDAALERELAALAPLGKPLAVHAIGGRAIEQVITVLERLRAAGLGFPQVRLEHVQFITLAQARRAKALGAVLSMQPNFSSDSVDYEDRVAPRTLAANNPFRMLLDQAGFQCGKDLIFGSDGMPHGVEYALQWSLFPAFPGQRLTLEELLQGYGVPPVGQGHSLLTVDWDRRTVRLMPDEEC